VSSNEGIYGHLRRSNVTRRRPARLGHRRIRA
jgi:hypothetical protein